MSASDLHIYDDDPGGMGLSIAPTGSKTGSKRPGRRMPRLRDCEAHWDVAPSTCIRCGAIARCERAHLIDRSLDGLDGVQNVVPLCVRCHKAMPAFFPGEEAKALSWLVVEDSHEWLLAQVHAVQAQFPDEWAAATREDTWEAAEALVLLPLDWSLVAADRPRPRGLTP